MQIPSDYRDLLRLLNKHKVRYLIVGAYAVAYYTEPRYTKDLDIWIEPEIENARRVYKALKEFGAPLKNITLEDFTNKNLFYQIGVAPVRVDIIVDISDMDFKVVWRHRRKTSFEGINVNIIGISELIKSKEKTKRPFDMKDVEILKLRLKLRRRKR